MSILQRGARVGAATVVVGLSLAWPQAAGIASADKADQDSASVSEVGILKDLGYDVADPPQILAIFVIGFAFIRRRNRSDEHHAG